MKRKHLLILFIISFAFMLFACDEESNPSESNSDKFVGTWKLIKLEFLDTPQGDLVVFDDANSDFTLRVTFTNDNKYTSLWEYEDEDSDTSVGTWSVTDSRLTLVSDTTEVMNYQFLDNGDAVLSGFKTEFLDGEEYFVEFTFRKED